MDPVSISASIIAVLQAANAVVLFCYDYRAAIKNSSWELPRMIEEVKGLRNVLESLERLTSNAERADPDARSRLPTLHLLCKPKTGDEGGLLDMCLEELNRLKRKLAPPGWVGPVGSKRMALAQALTWPLKESDTKKTLENIGRFRDTLTLALTADQTTLVLSIEEVVQATKEKTLSVHKELGKLTKSNDTAKIVEHRDKIHKWLAAPDPSSNHIDALGTRQATTGSWFIGSPKFANWKRNPNSFLWLYGIPGCGKTILASTIIQDLERCHLNLNIGATPNPSQTYAVVYFYFAFSDDQKQNHEKMIRSLIKQLSQQLQYTSAALELLFSSCTNGNRQPTTEALRRTLGQMIKEFNQVFIVLDALDECKDREELVESIHEITGWGLQMLHILATSRKEKEIEDGFDLTDEQKINIQGDLIESDIRAYIYAMLQTNKKLKRWQKDEQYQHTIVSTLMEKADGMFRWVSCQLDALKKCLTRRELQATLESLPETLDETYERILCSIDKERSESALKILQWLAYSARPLQIEEAADVIAVNVKSRPRIDPESRLLEPRDILTICSSLVTTNTDITGSTCGKEVGEQIRLAHLSVRDYLISKRILDGKASQYSIQEIRAHESIAQVSLAYLLGLGEPGSLCVKTAQHFPLTGYAAEYWPQHTRALGKETEQIVELSMELFSSRDAFANWIRLYDSDKASTIPVAARRLNSVAAPLYYASQGGLQDPVRLLIERGADVNAHGGVYGSALQAASAGGFHETVKLLLVNQAEVNARGGIHGSALQAASVEGHSKVVQLLLKEEAKVELQGGLYGNALQAASAGGHDEIVEQLIVAGADCNALGGSYGTALHAASYGGHNGIVQRLLNAGAEIELRDSHGRTALNQAALEGHTTTTQLLLKNGADVNAEDKSGWAALDEAGPNGHEGTVQALLDAGATVDSPDQYGHTALHFTASQGHMELVRLLLRKGADANFANGTGETPLQYAASAGRGATVKALLDGGAHVNTANHSGWSALHAAVMIGNEATVRVLLDEGAEISADKDGWTPLHLAALNGDKSMVHLLLENGADITAEDSGGRTGRDWAALSEENVTDLERQARYKAKVYFTLTGLRGAASKGEEVRVRQLLKNGADINAEDDGCWTALLWAACRGHRSTMLLLIENGADVNAKNQDGRTVMDYADQWRQDETIMRLLERRFNFQAKENERLLAFQRRRSVLRLLATRSKGMAIASPRAFLQ